MLVFVSIADFNRAQRSPLYHLRNTDTLELDDEGTVPTSRLKRLVAGSEVYNFAIQHVHIAQLVRRVVIAAVFPSKSGGVPVAGEESKSISSKFTDQQRLVAHFSDA